MRRILFFLLAGCALVVAEDRVQQPTEHVKHRFDVYTALEHASHLKKAYVEILDELEASKIYWESVDFHPLRYLLAQSPLYWVTGKPRSKVQRKHLKNLDALTEQIATNLGILQTAITNANNEGSDDTLEGVRYLVEKELGAYGNSKAYKNAFLKKHKPWLQPNHLVRNWVPYTIAGIGLVTAALYVYKNPETITSHISKMRLYTTNFYNDSATNLKEAKEVLFEGNKAIEKKLESRKVAQAQTYDAYLRDNHSKLTPDQRKEHVDDAVTNQNMSLLDKDEVEIGEQPILHPKKAIRIGLLKVQSAETIVFEYLRKYNGLLAILAITPAYLIASALAKGGYFLLKTGYRAIAPANIVPMHIKKLLLNLQQHYNSNLYDPYSSEPQKLGVETYYHYKLEQISHFIAGKDRLQFKRDIEKLAHTTDTNQQKYNLISMMINRYEFLHI